MNPLIEKVFLNYIIYEEQIKLLKPRKYISKFSVYLIENHDVEKVMANEEDLKEAFQKYSELMKDFDGSYKIKDTTDRIECYQALKRTEREKKIKSLQK